MKELTFTLRDPASVAALIEQVLSSGINNPSPLSAELEKTVYHWLATEDPAEIAKIFARMRKNKHVFKDLLSGSAFIEFDESLALTSERAVKILRAAAETPGFPDHLIDIWLGDFIRFVDEHEIDNLETLTFELGPAVWEKSFTNRLFCGTVASELQFLAKTGNRVSDPIIGIAELLSPETLAKVIRAAVEEGSLGAEDIEFVLFYIPDAGDETTLRDHAVKAFELLGIDFTQSFLGDSVPETFGYYLQLVPEHFAAAALRPLSPATRDLVLDECCLSSGRLSSIIELI